MSVLLVLNLFPTSGLDHSLFPPILLGLVLMVLFNETFGWPLSGIVVGGYLAPIFLISPLMGALILFESFLTYLLFILVSEKGAQLGLWDRFFGRERFLLFLLLGILLRFFIEGILNNYLQSLYLHQTKYLLSVGTILIPLIANSFWNSGFRNNWGSMFSILALTYLLIRFLLIPYTNFSLLSFQVSFEEFALDLSSSAKIYIILLSTAYLASNSNLKWGWDYGGIIVPALMALAWFSPWRVVLTIIEISIVYGFSQCLFPLFRQFTLEGGRRILYIFGLDFLYKLIVGAFFGFAQSEGLDELYGFGYLLPSLVVLKIWQKGYFHTLRITLQTSFFGAVFGSGIALLLGILFPPTLDFSKPQLIQKHFTFYQAIKESGQRPLKLKAPTIKEKESFEKLMELVFAAQAFQDQAIFKRATFYSSLAGYSTLKSATHFILKEPKNSLFLKGFGNYFFRLRPKNLIILEVLDSTQRPLIELIPFLNAFLKPQAIFLGHNQPFLKLKDPFWNIYSGDLHQNPNSPYFSAHKQFQKSHFLQLSLQKTIKHPRLLILKGTREQFALEKLLKIWPDLKIEERRAFPSHSLLYKQADSLARLHLPEKIFSQNIVPFHPIRPVSGLVDRFISRLNQKILKDPLRIQGNIPEEIRKEVFKPLLHFMKEFPKNFAEWKNQQENGLLKQLNVFEPDFPQEEIPIPDFLGRKLFQPLNNVYIAAKLFRFQFHIFYWRGEYFFVSYQTGLREFFIFRLNSSKPDILQLEYLEENEELLAPALQLFFNSQLYGLLITSSSFKSNLNYHLLRQYLSEKDFILLNKRVASRSLIKSPNAKRQAKLFRKVIPRIQEKNSQKESVLALGKKQTKYYQSQKALWLTLIPEFKKLKFEFMEEDCDKFLRRQMLLVQASKAKSAKRIFKLLKKKSTLLSEQNLPSLLNEIKRKSQKRNLILGAFYDPLTCQIMIFIGGKPTSYVIRIDSSEKEGQSEVLWPQSTGKECQLFLEKRRFCLILKTKIPSK